MYGLSIQLLSFKLKPGLINQIDNIRVSITTVPDDTKQAFIINASKIHNIHHQFTVNISDKTKKIIFVFRKKNSLQEDPIIASTIIHSYEFPRPNEIRDTEIKKFNILEPLCNLKDMGCKNPTEKRRIFGEMVIQMMPTDLFPVPLFDDSYKILNKYNKPAISHHSKKPVHIDENQNVVFNKNWVFN